MIQYTMQEQLTNYLQLLRQESTEVTHSKGFTYFHHGLMPRILEAGKVKGFDRELLAGGWTRVGAIFALNAAPKRSMECLQKAMTLARGRAETIDLLIDQLILTGEFHAAFELIQQLIEIDPDRFEWMTKRQRIQDDINYDSEPQLQAGDLIWELNEKLAAEQFEAVITRVIDTNMDDVLLLKKLACAYGAVGHNSNYFQVWETIKRIDPNVNIDPVDQFYQPLKE